jgi:putative PIN family toxin of toxin-antitoxin system
VRVFLDTNVVVSAYVARGLCVDLLALVLAEHDLVTAEVQLRELHRVLVTKIGAAEADAQQVVDQLSVFSGPAPADPLPAITADADDAWILAAAIAGSADILVSGDQHLLTAAPRVTELRILSARDAWVLLRDIA